MLRTYDDFKKDVSVQNKISIILVSFQGNIYYLSVSFSSKPVGLQPGVSRGTLEPWSRICVL